MRIAFLLLTASGLAAGPALTEPINIGFVDHITGSMIEQDVYVDKSGDGGLYRVTTEDAGDYTGETVYRASAMVEHAPMDASRVGPYGKGEALGFTLAEWLAGSGTGALDCNDGRGELTIEFAKLVPNGLYTMWNFFAAQQLAEFHTYDLPVGAADGSQSVFTADETGRATFSASFEPCLQGSNPQLMAGLAIAYHSDGMTHGHEP